MKKTSACAEGAVTECRMDSSLAGFKGVGPARRAALAKLGLRTVFDLLYFFPRRYEDRRNVKKISALVPGEAAVVDARVITIETKIISRARRLTTCTLTDGTQELCAVWFYARGVERALTRGTRVLLYGVPEHASGVLRMTQPEYKKFEQGEPLASSGFTGIVPIYPSTAGMPQKWFRALAREVVEDYAPYAPEPIPRKVIDEFSLMPISCALHEMHMPHSLDGLRRARRRVAFEELFTLRMALAVQRRRRAGRHAVVLSREPYAGRLISSLPFVLTPSQSEVIDELFAQGATGHPISCLLQGDVGSGKTLVSLIFASGVCGSGAQCAVMAPTEILAEQLYGQACKYLSPLGIKCALLTSGVTGVTRRKVLADAASGDAAVIVGTQSILSGDVKFRTLGALIIDEQQRFGVRQRMSLLEGTSAHLVMMSATPIPRTMALVLYGDLDILIIKEKPAGRTKAATRIIESTKENITALLHFLAREVKSGGRVYWICPRVTPNEKSALPSAVARYEWLSKKFSLTDIKISLIHGRMGPRDKEAALDAFRNGSAQILVGTTVLEVGVDVPEACVIVIESPERYGLAQLHQLAGRVGRGARAGLCVLITRCRGAQARLGAFAAAHDGFEIAREDLKLRGTGEFTGTLQHGRTELCVADLRRDAQIAEQAAHAVQKYMASAQREDMPAELMRRVGALLSRK